MGVIFQVYSHNYVGSGLQDPFLQWYVYTLPADVKRSLPGVQQKNKLTRVTVIAPHTKVHKA